MTDPRPTDQLVAEHERILVLLEVVSRLADAAEAELPSEALIEDIAAAVDAVRVFADTLHHGKEEALLFPALEEHGVPREGGPIGCMLHEHDEGRGLVDDMESALEDLRAGRASGAADFAQAAAGFVPLLRQHIRKENQVLFPLAEQVLGAERRASLLEAFAEVESEDVGRGRLEQVRAAMDALAGRWLGEPVS